MQRLSRETYLQTLRNACGSQLFRNLYVQDDQGKVTDVMENGNLSCAIFVTSILCMFSKIDRRHATVEGTIKALPAADWLEVGLDQLQEGDILVWEKIAKPTGSGGSPYDQSHGHIGFYLGNESAVSNSSANGFPIIHNWQYDGARKVIQAFRHAWLPEVIETVKPN